jgi:hypothetical protein
VRFVLAAGPVSGPVGERGRASGLRGRSTDVRPVTRPERESGLALSRAGRLPDGLPGAREGLAGAVRLAEAVAKRSRTEERRSAMTTITASTFHDPTAPLGSVCKYIPINLLCSIQL